MKYFVISDTHSFYTETIKALNEKGYDSTNENHTLILCGDAFDRGKESKQMFEWLQSLPQDRFVYIKGNHEDLLQECYNDIKTGVNLSYHHLHNGTLNTISDICDVNWYDIGLVRETDRKIEKDLQPLLNFIDKKCVDYFETNNYVFVHGWIPCVEEYRQTLGSYQKEMVFDNNWRTGNWSDARWVNGIEAWKKGIKIEGKTIVCGHWHCSWGWSHIDQKRKEFPPKNHIDWQKSFEPYLKDGIAAIDACTAYSGIVNCVIFDN